MSMARRACPPSPSWSAEAMDLALTPEQRAFREEVRAFLAASLSPKLRRGAALTSGVFAEPATAREWQALLESKGWLAYHWPDQEGVPGWTPVQSGRYVEERMGKNRV